MTAEAGLHDPVSCLLGQEIANWKEDSTTRLLDVLHQNQPRVPFDVRVGWLREDSIAHITFWVKKQTWPGGCGSKVGKSGMCLQRLPGMPSDANH